MARVSCTPAALLMMAVDVAYAVARGDDPPESFISGLAEGFDSDCGAALTLWRPPREGNHVSSASFDLATASLTPSDLRRANRCAAAHPLLASFAAGRRPPSPRVSDLVQIDRFWDTELWHAIHGVHGGRYPMGVALSIGRDHVRFVGLQRCGRDFTDAEIELVDRVLGPVAAAYTFRARLEEAMAALPEPRATCQMLTQRQREVLALVSRGKSDKQIASVLGIAERTVRKHLTDARDRTNTANRSAAAVWWESHK